MKGNAAVGEWLDELAARCGRSPAELTAKGLGASDFSADGEVDVEFEDGSRARFRYAFAVSSTRRGEVAVFTEHCGYWCFPRHAVTVRVLGVTEAHGAK